MTTHVPHSPNEPTDMPAHAHAPSTPPSPTRARGALVELAANTIRQKRTIIGLVLLLPIVVLALVGPMLAPEDPRAFVAAPFSGAGDGAGFLGADVAGRDVLSRILTGGRSTLLVAFAATVLGVGIGTVLGLTAALSRSWGDTAIMRTLDVLLAFPQYVFILILLAMFDASAALTISVIAIVWIPPVARVMRAAGMSVATQDFVRYSRALGEGRRRLLTGDVLVNVTAPLSVEFGLRLSYSIALVAGLSFLGFGPPPPTPDWGVMISENQAGLGIQPGASLAPVACVATLTLGVNMVAEGIAAALARGGRGTR